MITGRCGCRQRAVLNDDGQCDTCATDETLPPEDVLAIALQMADPGHERHVEDPAQIVRFLWTHGARAIGYQTEL